MAWTHAVAITIDHTKVPNTDQSNFPFFFSGAFQELLSTVHGGAVTSAVGFDIVFAADSVGSTILAFERVSYNQAAGYAQFWVDVPSLSHTTDTVIYLLIGNAAVTTDQQSATTVWDSNFKAIYHFKKSAALVGGQELLFETTTLENATASANPSTMASVLGPPTLLLNGSILITTPSLALSTFTVSAWLFPNTSGQVGAYFGFDGGSGNGVELRQNSADKVDLVKSGVTVMGTSSSAMTLNAWNHVAVTYDGTTVKFFINGVAAGTATSSQTFSAGIYAIGQCVSGDKWLGGMEELELSTSVRSADWIAASYNNQSSPSTFYSSSLTPIPWSPVGGAIATTAAVIAPFGIPVAMTISSGFRTLPTAANPVPLVMDLPPAAIGWSYSEQVSVEAGTAPYAYSISAGALPPGMSLDAVTGILAGTPTIAGTYTFTIQIVDAHGTVGSHAFSLEVIAPGSPNFGITLNYLVRRGSVRS